jgi:hypothetical protein
MPPAGFEPAIPASEWPQTNALNGAATGTGYSYYIYPGKYLLALASLNEALDVKVRE